MNQKIQFSGDNPQPRFGHTISMIQKHRAILFGGAVGDTGKYIITGDTFICDISGKKWKKLEPKGTIPSNRAAHCSVFIDSSLLIYGGALGGGQLADDLLYQLDLKNGQQKAVWLIKKSQGGTPGRRYGHVMVYLKPYIVVFGGNTGNQPVNDVWTFDYLEKNIWAKVDTGSEIPQPRVYHSAAICRTGSANGMMVIFGGRTTDQSALNDAWGLRKHRDGSLDWVKAPYKSSGEIPKARYQHSTLFLGTLMLVVGGRNNQIGQTLPFDIYDTETSQWFKLNSIERFRHACWISDTFLYIHAGFDQDSPNVPTENILRIDLSKVFLPYNVLFKGLTFETGKDYHSFNQSKSQHTQNTITKVIQSSQKQSNYPQSQQVVSRAQKISERMEIQSENKNRNKKIINNKTIKLCPEIIVASYDYNDEQIIKKVDINQLMQQNRRLKDPIIFPNSKEYLEKIYTVIINSFFLKSPSPLASLSTQIIFALLEQVEKIIQVEPTLLRLRAPIKIFGDIHGQLNDLNKLFQTFGSPTDDIPLGDIQSTDYLFLGDYVDRGTKSVETILLLFALKLKYPENIHLLRGAHQDKKINRSFGFGDQCISKFKQDLQNSQSFFFHANKVFQKLPLAAIIQDKIFCVHGGIGNTLKNLNQIELISRPCQVVHDPKTQNQKIIQQLLWSDPSQQGQGVVNTVHDYFKTKQNIKYGPYRTNKFCNDNNIVAIIRSHQPVQGIYKTDSNVITIFSCTDYCGQGNSAGIVSIKRSQQIAPKLLPVYAIKEQRWWTSEELSKIGRNDQQNLRKLAVTPIKK